MSPYLSLDIQVEIIKKLPVKSLIQFRSVCKSWKSLINSSQFVAGYSQTQSHHLVISYQVGYGKESEVKYICFVDDDTFPQQKFALSAPPLAQGTAIISSSHGLLFLTNSFRDPDDLCHPSNTHIAVLWNPAIRKSIVVAMPNVVHQPFVSVVGFGVCPDTKDPKLVKITCIDDHTKLESISCIPSQVMVFTLSSREWTCLCSGQLPRKSIVFTWSQAVIGQFIYWFAYDVINVDGESRNLIMSFDMSTEEFREVDLPDTLAEWTADLSIFRLRESLAVVACFTEQVYCDVWMMEHGDSKVFTKLFTINPPNASSVWATLGFRNSGEPIFEMKSDNKDFTTLVVYEPCSEHIKDLGIRKNHYLVGSSYTESLLLLDHDDHDHIVRRGKKRRLLEQASKFSKSLKGRLRGFSTKK